MSRLKVSEDIQISLSYIISHFNASDIDFLYENYRTLNEKHNLKALKILKKEDLLRCFLDGFITLKALGEKDLQRFMTVKEHITNMLLDLKRIDNYFLAYKRTDYGIDRDNPYPLTVDEVLNLINLGQWEIVNLKE